jgi:hypothetical protein
VLMTPHISGIPLQHLQHLQHFSGVQRMREVEISE